MRHAARLRYWTSLASLIAVAAAAPPAVADRGPMNAAVDRAVDAGNYPQALANLRRLAASRSVPLNDPAVMRRMDEVWELWLRLWLDASSTAGLPRVAVLTQLARYATAQGAPLAAAAFTAEQDVLLDEWMASQQGPRSERLAAARAGYAAAGGSAHGTALVDDAVHAMREAIDRLAATGRAADGVRALLLAPLELDSRPAPLFPYTGGYALEASSDDSADVADQVRRTLPAGSGSAVAIKMRLRCDLSDETGTTTKALPYRRPGKEVRTERREILVPFIDEEVSFGAGPLTCDTNHDGDRVCTQESWTIRTPVTRYDTEWVDEDVLVDVMVDEVDEVEARWRTTTMAAVGDLSVSFGGDDASRSFEARVPVTEYEFTSDLAGQSSAFGDARAQLVDAAAAQLRDVVVAFVQRASDAHRVAALRADLASLAGAPRLTALLELALLEHAFTPELTAIVADQTGLAPAEVAALARGQSPAIPSVSMPDIDFLLAFSWPEPDSAGVEGLKIDEARAVLRAKPVLGGSASLGLTYLDTTDGSRFGASLAFDIHRMPAFFMFRPVSISGIVRGAFDLFPREYLIARSNLTGGIALGLHPPVVDLQGYAEAGVDHAFVAVPDDVATPAIRLANGRVPAAFVVGAGARLRIADKLAVSVGYQHRFSDVYPQRWEAEAWLGSTGFVGLRATAHRDLFGDPSATAQGPLSISIVLGGGTNLGSSSAESLTTEADRVR